MRNFLSIQVDYWDNPWQNRHAFLWELSVLHPVYFLSPPFYLLDLIRENRFAKTKMKGFSEIKSGLFSCVPPRYLPYNYRLKSADNMVTKMRDKYIDRKLKNLGMSKPVLIIWHPRFVHMIDKFDAETIVYYKYDNYSGYFGGKGEPDLQEKELIKRSDLVFVTSQGLFDMHREECPPEKLHLLPNGVDYDRFAVIDTVEYSAPDDLKSIPAPRIGYIGVVNEKVDFELLTYMCNKRPDWSVVLIGPEKVKQPDHRAHLKKLQECPNFYLLGNKTNDKIPAYVNAMDVCMMCYIVNDWTYYGYPLKMHEYLAVGKPVISTDLPAVREFENVISIESTPEKWVQAVDNLLINDSNELKALRQKTAKQNSWRKRVEKFIELIDTKAATA